jgi:arginase
LSAVRLIAAPYDDGELDWRMGRGARLIASEPGIEAEIDVIETIDRDRPQVARAFELARELSARVRAARERGELPVVLAGNCSSCAGTASGLDGRVGAVWFDAHADFDTPEDNQSGFFDVMALSILTGDAWQALAAGVPGFRPVDEADVVMAAVRDLEPYQRERLERSGVAVVPGAVERAELETALERLRVVDSVYLHVDLDALDGGAGRANQYAAPGGPSADALVECVAAVVESLPVKAVALTAYDPGADPERRVLGVAQRILRLLG